MAPQSYSEVKQEGASAPGAGPRKSPLRPGLWLSRVLTPYVVLIVALGVTGAISYFEAVTTRAKRSLRFETLARETRDVVAGRVQVYEALLRAGAGIFAASDYVTRDEFRVFARILDLRRNYPGLQGIGYAAKFTPEAKDTLIASMRAQGARAFTVKPDYPRAEYTAIVYLEPLDERNQAAIGYDMFTEAVRREAMIRARDTGEAAASGGVILLQEIDHRKLPGFLIYYPVYTHGPDPATVSERRRRLQGFVYCPIRATHMLSTIVGRSRQELMDVEFYEGRSAEPSRRLSDSWPRHASRGPLGSLRQTLHLPVAGRTWTMTATPRPRFAETSDADRAPRILLTGLVLSLVLFKLSLSQSAARRQAEDAAEELAASQDALFKATQQITAIMESITDGFIAVDRDWSVVFVNQQAGRLAGRSPTDLQGRMLWDVYPGLAGEAAETQIRNAMSSGVGVQFEAADALMPGWADIRAYPSSEGLSLYFADINDRKRAEESLVEAYRQQTQISMTLQQALLAVDVRAIEGIKIEPYYQAAGAEALVGGDFYDVFEPSPGYVGVVIGDVAGKGLGSATRTALVKHTLRALAYEDPAPEKVLTRLNRIVTRETQEGFVTLFYGVFNIREREFVFASAGHEPPLWLVPGVQKVIDIEAPGVVLGIEEEFAYQQFRIEMDHGHQVLLYTDGITEARDGDEFYGLERLRTAFMEQQGSGAAETLNAIIEQVRSFAHGEMRDDVAAVLLCLE